MLPWLPTLHIFWRPLFLCYHGYLPFTYFFNPLLQLRPLEEDHEDVLDRIFTLK